MATAKIVPAPEPTLRRLPTYHGLLKQFERQGREVVSCTRIAEALGLDPTQVRKDLAVTGIVGKPKVGYVVSDLIEAVEGFFGWRNVTDAFLAGVGGLGAALLGYDGLKQYGLNIIAAFDTDLEKIGTKVRGKPVLALKKLPDLARRMRIPLGIITVPPDAAQEVADLMVSGGISGLWNFVPVALRVPEGIIIENERLASGLAVLSRKLLAAMRASPVEKGVAR